VSGFALAQFPVTIQTSSCLLLCDWLL